MSEEEKGFVVKDHRIFTDEDKDADANDEKEQTHPATDEQTQSPPETDPPPNLKLRNRQKKMMPKNIRSFRK
jgi:hypothetical protein